ncbi:MAG: DMT family transporter [Bacteroidales bacterium]|nr:DMT family transporter [Bacteroidales bacterium]
MWIYLAFLSAFLLGIYDICKKASLNTNAVIPVLFLNTLFSSLLFLPFIIISGYSPESLDNSLFYVPAPDIRTHGLIFIKSLIVLSSWIFAYFATKHLPLTILGPIKATQPIVVLLGALLIFQEKLNLYQWIGVLLAILSLYLLSLSGKKEGINFHKDKWILFMILSVITGASSGLYDKYLMRELNPMTVQSWYNIYQALTMGIVLLTLWYPNKRKTTPFQWRWTIPLISIFLSLADFAYFHALSEPDAMISVVSMVRRSNVVVTFLAGAILYKEKNLRNKAFDLFLILLGMFFLYLGSKI